MPADQKTAGLLRSVSQSVSVTSVTSGPHPVQTRLTTCLRASWTGITVLASQHGGGLCHLMYEQI